MNHSQGDSTPSVKHQASSIKHQALRVVVLGLLLLISSIASAQTPPPCPVAPPPIYLPYTTSLCQHVALSVDCGVTICWCERNVGTYPDMTITSVTPDAGPGCDNLSWKDLLLLARTKLLQFKMATLQPGDCDSLDGQDTLSMSLGLCYNLSVNSNVPPAYTIANCSEAGWCQTIYTVCVNLGSKYISAVKHTFTPGNCTSPPPVAGEWTLGNCYQVFGSCPND